MKVACLVPYPLRRVPSQRYRLEQWATLLQRRGIETRFYPFLDAAGFAGLYERGRLPAKAARLLRGSLARAGWALRHARDHDVVVIHREATPFGLDWVERLVSSRVPTVFDFDDAIWLPNVSSANRPFAVLKGSAKTDRILRHVTAVSAGCDYLAQHARPFNASVFVVPTSIDLGAYGPPRQHTTGEPLVVGWSGSLTTAPYLQLVGPALRRAAQRFPLRVIVYGGQLELPGVDTECIPWSPETEVSVLRRFDVGIKPMPSEEWVRGKCPMKELQYMALGVPPVATRFGTALEAIDHGVTGLLCSNEDDWVDALATLRSADLRARLGAAARRTVEERYSAERAAAAFEVVLNEALTRFVERRARKR